MKAENYYKEVLQKGTRKNVEGRTVLRLANRQLQRLQDILSVRSISLEDVVDMDVQQNHLKMVEAPQLDQLIRLSRLDLGHNYLGQIDQGIAQLQALTWLCLRGNRIQAISPALQQLPLLAHLDLSVNNLLSIDHLAMPQLTNLDLSHNQIRTICNLNSLPMLTHLDLKKNRISEMAPLAVQQLNSLVDLNLGYNCIHDLHDVSMTTLQLASLTSLNLTGNDVTQEEHYRMRVLAHKGLLSLDNQNVQSYLRDHMERLHHQVDYQQIGQQIRQEHQDRLQDQARHRATYKQMLRDQEQRVDSLFDRYTSQMEDDLEQFTRYAHRHAQGGEVVPGELVREDWKQKVEQMEAQRKRLADMAQRNQALIIRQLAGRQDKKQEEEEKEEEGDQSGLALYQAIHQQTGEES